MLRLDPSFPPHRTPKSQGWTATELATWLDELARDQAWPPPERLAQTWERFLNRLRAQDDASRELRRVLADTLGFSPAGLDAALATMIETVSTPACFELLRRDPRAEARGPSAARMPALVILTAQPPALALQFLFAAVAARRPILFKSSRREPWSAPWLLGQLADLEPDLARAFGATSWKGGDLELEAAAFAHAELVVVYGSAATQSSVAARCPAHKLWGLGPKFSVALIDPDPAGDWVTLCRALAADIALLDQRGCLSLQAILTPKSQAEALAASLAQALEWAAVQWPPGAMSTEMLGEIRLCREEAELAGLVSPELPLRTGTVVVEKTDSALRLSSGGRLVRIYPCSTFTRALDHIRPWQAHLQGLVLSENLSGFEDLFRHRWKIPWVTRPGRLQFPDLATWANGGRTAYDLLTSTPQMETTDGQPAHQSIGL